MIQSPTARGIAIFLLAGLMFTGMDLMAKLLASRVHITQTLWARYAVQMVIVTALITPRARQVLKTKYPRLQAVRSVFLFAASVFFFAAYLRLDLAESIAISQLSPLWLTLGGAIFLGERFGPARLIAVLIGLCGALIIIRPGTEAFTPWSFLPLIGTLCYAGYALTTRFVGADEDVWTSLFYSALFATVVLTVAMPFTWVPLERSDIPFLIGIGAFGAAGQLFLIRALSLTEAGILAPFFYCSFLWAVIFQITIFGDLPDTATLIGALVIVAAGLYVWRRETRKSA
ncbi:DMT family transporter [Litoreibacter roseus]|uniref:DMT transporter permease n=1 Tax=Litoreibacter roseus TaxID=2601869 RepID=A0A6N6JED1_9RHOB|nr:DMT family transporter [Litoreibacter roseus]GFE63648.1 DMT transporter permease [Litoreibacter roseus]